MKKTLSSLLVLAILLSLFTFPAFVSKAAEPTKIYYFNDFNKATDLDTLTTSGTGTTTATIPENSGYFALETPSTGGGSESGFVSFSDSIINLSSVPKADRPDLVLEFKMRASFTSGYFSSWDTVDKYKVKTFQLLPASGLDVTKTAGNFAQVKMDNHANEPVVYYLAAPQEWHTYQIVYYANEEKRSLYIDGAHVADRSGTGFDNRSENVYSKYGILLYDILPSIKKANSSVHFDYIKIYEKPEDFGNENLFYYNDFDSIKGFSREVLAGDEIVYGLDKTEDGESVFKAQGTDVYQNDGNFIFRLPNVAPDASVAPDELVLEYRFRLSADNPESYLGTNASDKTASAPARSKGVDFARGLEKDKVYFYYADKEPIPGDYSINTKEWTTVSIVYPKNRLSRDIYINGEYIATSPEGNLENTYAAYGENMFALLPDFKCSEDLLEVDYVKFYGKSESAPSAELVSANNDEIIISLTGTPGNIAPDKFNLSGDIAISEIKRIDSTTYALIPEEALPEGSYTLTLNGLKDVLAREITASEMVFDLGAPVSEENVYLNYQFEEDAAEEIQAIKDVTVTRKSSFEQYLPYINSADGKLIFGGPGNGSQASYMTISPEISDIGDVKSDLVLEYKMKMNPTNANQNYLGYDDFRYTVDEGMIHIKKAGISWKASDAAFTTGDFSTWHTIAIRYEADAPTRTLYVDGVNCGSITDSPKAKTDEIAPDEWTYNAWYQTGKAWFTFKNWTYKTPTDTVEFEYIKVYSPSDNFTADVKSVSDDLKTITLDFNGTVGNISSDMFKVSGMTPVSVEIADEAEQIYELTLPAALNAGSTFDLAVMGVSDTLGNVCNDIISFKTRAAEEYVLTVSENIENAGRIEINGVNEKSADVSEGSDAVITVEPYINYTATVTVNGKNLFIDRFDKCTVRDIKEDTEVKVTYTKTSIIAEAGATDVIETIRKPYTDSISAYIFGVLRQESSDFGVILSSSKSNLNLEAVAAGKAYKFAAENTNAYGEYGVRIIDVAKVLGKTVYAIPYAVYENGVYYGTAIGIGR